MNNHIVETLTIKGCMVSLKALHEVEVDQYKKDLIASVIALVGDAVNRIETDEKEIAMSDHDMAMGVEGV